MFDFHCQSKNAKRVEQWEQHSKQKYRTFLLHFYINNTDSFLRDISTCSRHVKLLLSFKKVRFTV